MKNRDLELLTQCLDSLEATAQSIVNLINAETEQQKPFMNPPTECPFKIRISADNTTFLFDGERVAEILKEDGSRDLMITRRHQPSVIIHHIELADYEVFNKDFYNTFAQKFGRLW